MKLINENSEISGNFVKANVDRIAVTTTVQGYKDARGVDETRLEQLWEDTGKILADQPRLGGLSERGIGEKKRTWGVFLNPKQQISESLAQVFEHEVIGHAAHPGTSVKKVGKTDLHPLRWYEKFIHDLQVLGLPVDKSV